MELPRILEFPSGNKNVPPTPVDQTARSSAAEPVMRVRNTPVPPGEILKGYEIGKDEFVVLEPQEVAALRPKTSSELEITEFVPLQEIDPMYYETSYYVIPEPGGETAYALLFAALKETGHAGIGSLAMHGREHVILIRAGRDSLVAHSLFYANEVGRPAYLVESDRANPKQLELAKMLVGAFEAKFEPERWKDRYEEGLKALIESRTPVASADAVPAAAVGPAPGVDILEALRKSLEMARKPVASEARQPKPKRQPARRK